MMTWKVKRWSSFVALIWAATAMAGDSPKEVAQQIRGLANFNGGLIVHLGCGDGKLTAALRKSDNCTVQGLDADLKNVDAARKEIQSQGLYGKVSANQLSGKRLPYVDNLVSVLVVSDESGIEREEMLRVLAPYGTAVSCSPKSKTPAVLATKPYPKEMDEWQQHYHDADNNAVAHDSLVGPPRRYQWISDPEWSRAHLLLPSIHSMVSSKGRLFTIEDQASAEHPALPGKFSLVARDAFNGILLWQNRFPDWHPINLYIKFMPVQMQRRLAAIGNIVYCTPGYTAPITALDAATGKILHTYSGTDRTTEFAYDKGILYVVTGDLTDTVAIGDTKGSIGTSQFGLAAYGPIMKKIPNPVSTLTAIQADSGKPLWQKAGNDTRDYQGNSLAIRGNYVVYCTSAALVCVDGATGKPLWRVAAPLEMRGPSGTAVCVVLSDTTVFLADSKTLRAFSLKDGAKLWSGSAHFNHHKPADVMLANGVVWSSSHAAYNPLTGQTVGNLAQKMTGPMGHDRCYRNRITDRFYINTATGGSDFLDLTTPGEYPHPWVRSTCGIGPLPCNGMFYAGPPACACCNWIMLNAFNALTAEPGLKSSGQPIKIETTPKLIKGPAFAEISQLKEETANSPEDWPTYRHDIARSGVTKNKASATLKPRWSAKFASRASAPVIAAGKVFVADVEAHAVCALNAQDGAVAWTYTTGGRVDSPPTYYQGLLLFGSRDGWAYCLRASDGALVWRFRDLPEDRNICAYGQIESAWPICGSVLVKNDLAYFAAGRNSFVDGGISVYAVEPQTGRVVHQRRMYGPYDPAGYPIIERIAKNSTGLPDAKEFASATDPGLSGGGKEVDGFKNDIFVADNENVYLRHQAFTTDLSPLRPGQGKAHLIPSHGFLEAIPHHRSFWTIDTTISYDIATGRSSSAHGDILVLDGSRFFEVRGYTPGRTESFDPRPNGYTLYAGTTPTAPAAPLTKKQKKAKAQQTVSGQWSAHIPLTGKAMAMANDLIFIAGTPVAFPSDDLAKAYEGRMGGVLWIASAANGQKLGEYKLDAAPVWDSLAIANGQVFLATQDGKLHCFGSN